MFGVQGKSLISPASPLFDPDLSLHPEFGMSRDGAAQRIGPPGYRNEIEVQGAAGVDFDGGEVRGLDFAVGVGLDFAGGNGAGNPYSLRGMPHASTRSRPFCFARYIFLSTSDRISFKVVPFWNSETPMLRVMPRPWANS